MAKFEVAALVELKTRLPAKPLPLVEEYKEKLEKLTADQGARLTLEKGDDPKELRRAFKGGGNVVEPPDPVPVPRGGGVRQLLSRGQAWTERAAAKG